MGLQGHTLIEEQFSASHAVDKALRPDRILSCHAFSSTTSGTSFHTAGPSPPTSPALQQASPIVLGQAPPSERSSDQSDPQDTNLNHFHQFATIGQTAPVGHFTKVRGLSDCCRGDGKIELHRQGGSEDVAVIKRILTTRVHANKDKEVNERLVHRHRCERDAEDPLNELGVYSLLARQRDVPQYLLRMLAVFESGPDVWLVLEHADGGDLFNVVEAMNGRGKGQDTLKQFQVWMWQLLQAVAYLHRHGVGHRDISVENVLLRSGSVRLMDFGQSVQTHSPGGEPFRYFCPVGKPYYRGPECHVPAKDAVEVVAPQGSRPGEVVFTGTAVGNYLCQVHLPKDLVPGQSCQAEPWGYTVAPVDVFACGVCLFVMTTGAPPWRQAMLCDPHFAWVHSQGIVELLKAWNKSLPPAAEDLLVSMLRSDPTRRPSVDTCLAHSWFEPLRCMPVPTHPNEVAEAAGSAELAWADTIALTGMAGDFYGVPDACRSAASVDPYTAVGASMCGDFYSAEADFGQIGALEASTPCSVSVGTSAALPPTLDLKGQSKAPREVIVPPRLERFSDNDLPRSVPLDSHFRLEPTTLHVTGSTPADVANHILAFLSVAAGASVLKVDRAKLSIKAEEDGEAGACSFKVRVWCEGGGRYAVEFQRRGGDSTALHRVYRQAVQYLAHLVQALACDGGDEAESSEVLHTATRSPCASSSQAKPAPQAKLRATPKPQTKSEAKVEAKREATPQDVELSSLRLWAEPGVRGLLTRSRRTRSEASSGASSPVQPGHRRAPASAPASTHASPQASPLERRALTPPTEPPKAVAAPAPRFRKHRASTGSAA